MKEGERRVLIAKEPPVIRNVLYVLLARAESDGSIPRGTCETLEKVAKEGCDGLILDLRAVEDPLGELQPRIRDVRSGRLGQVLVITCDVAGPLILQEIEKLCHPHFFPKHFISSLCAFVHALF